MEVVCGAVGEGLSDGEDAAVVIMGAVEMTDAVLVVAEPIVVPGGNSNARVIFEVVRLLTMSSPSNQILESK